MRIRTLKLKRVSPTPPPPPAHPPPDMWLKNAIYIHTLLSARRHGTSERGRPFFAHLYCLIANWLLNADNFNTEPVLITGSMNLIYRVFIMMGYYRKRITSDDELFKTFFHKVPQGAPYCNKHHRHYDLRKRSCHC